MSAQRNIKAHLSNYCRGGKAISITYSDCVFVAEVIQQAKRMRLNILPSAACVVLPYFTTLSHKLYDYRGEKVMEHKICVLITFHKFLYATFLILRTIERDNIINVYRPS